MTRSSLVWFATSTVAAVGTFYGVRAVLPPPETTVLPAAVALDKKPVSPIQPVSDKPEDPLLKRLRFLDSLGASDSSELRQMFQSTVTGRQEKRAVAQRWAKRIPPGCWVF